MGCKQRLKPARKDSMVESVQIVGPRISTKTDSSFAVYPSKKIMTPKENFYTPCLHLRIYRGLIQFTDVKLPNLGTAAQRLRWFE